MSKPSFFSRSITWLRETQHLRTSVMPEHRLEGGGGRGPRIDGHLALPSSAGRWAYAGLASMVFGAVMALFNMSGVPREVRDQVQRVGYGVEGGAVGCFVMAEVKRRRDRVPALVELRDRSSPVTAEGVEALRRDAGGAAAWFVAEGSVDPEVVDLAQRDGVRCFVAELGGFQELTRRS